MYFDDKYVVLYHRSLQCQMNTRITILNSSISDEKNLQVEIEKDHVVRY